jgi:hypothetical protein
MKAKDFHAFLLAVANMLEEATLQQDAAVWRALLPVFEVKPSISVSDISGIIRAFEPGETDEIARLESVIKAGPSLDSILASAGLKIDQKKRTLRDDLRDFLAALMPFKSASPHELVEAVRKKLAPSTRSTLRHQTQPRPDILQTYLPRLEQALGDNAQFTEVYNTLKADKLVRAPDAKKLSKAFAKETAQTKDQAFDLIWAHHSSLLQSRAKAAATAGRTAG